MRGDIAVLLFLALPLIPGASARAETIYKCKNEQGKLTYQESPCTRDVQAVSSWDAATAPAQDDEPESDFKGTYVIRQHNNGHYFVEATINGKPLTFVVDTGASAVALPRPVAFLARLSCRENIRMGTANGTTSVCVTVIPVLKFGPFVLKDVPATIVPNLDQPLLGMNVLGLFRIEQDNGEMRISKRN